jgi:hypothetical protein
MGPTATKDGTLYFLAYRNADFSRGGLFYSRYLDGRYAAPVLVDEAVNKWAPTFATFIAPDESYLIIASFTNPEGYGMGDLYISFKQADGSWGRAKNMGNKINGPRNERFPNLSPDGQFLFFNSNKRIPGAAANGPGNGSGDMYWIGSAIIDYLKNEDLDVIPRLERAYVSNGHEAALDEYRRLKAKHSEYYDFDQMVLIRLGVRLLEAGKKAEAIRILEENARLFSRSEAGLSNLLLSLLAGRQAESEAAANDFVRRYGQDQRPVADELVPLGNKLANLKMFKESIGLLLLNTGLFPQSDDAFYNLGQAYLKSGDALRATESFEKSLKLNSTNRHSQEALDLLRKKLTK